ncbi:A/G-specific adenine glycosylase [Streptomyces sp. NPDC059452]|uniref:A/G-specific adenine glycosylase n=1 Tax=Streptomyces sp. NPDC059452 TaxID=3346835 RepID=UPI0036A19C08
MTAMTSTSPQTPQTPQTPRTPAAAVSLHTPVIGWFEQHARDLPWRRPEAGAWGVMVSEFMLQQTPVNRVLPVYEQWLARWPRPADLAAEAPGEAVRAWGRLGYPRRALRLHGAAQAITERHGGDVPSEHAQLLALPGIGEYTAAAVASFAYGQRHAVLDTNVRRVFARAANGIQYPPNATTAAERKLARALLPDEDERAARWAAATMELGALVCTARNEDCDHCPIASQCAWRLAGKPAHQGPPRKGQTYAGTDRQVRGRLLAVLRDALDPVPQAALDAVWEEPVQRARALDGLVADGLVEPLADGRYRLPLT